MRESDLGVYGGESGFTVTLSTSVMYAVSLALVLTAFSIFIDHATVTRTQNYYQLNEGISK